MLSKKNVKLMIQKQQPRKQRFGIRKLSIGVVSVLLGLLFVGGGHSALADDQPGTDASVTTGMVSSASTSDQAVASTALPSPATASNASGSSAVADDTVTAEAAGDATVNTPTLAETPATNQTVPSPQPTAPVISPVPESNPVISGATESDTSASTQPGDSVAPESQVPAASDVPNVDSGSTAPEETIPGTDAVEVVTPPATDQPGKEVAQDNVQTVDKIHTDQILKDKYGIDVNHLDAKSVLLLASLFHIFANEANLGADVNGNIAVGILNGSVDFGTRGDSIHLTKGDIYYIQQLHAGLQNGSFRNEHFNHVIFGKDVNVEIVDGKVYVNGQHMVNLKPEEVFKDGAGTNYIDFPAIFQRLLKAAGFYASQEESAGVIKDFSNMNDRFIDVSNAVPKDNVIYVNIPYEYLKEPQAIKIYGLSSQTNGPTVVINVIGMPADGQVDISTQIMIFYDGDKTNPINPGESHAYPNHILWNFNASAAHINITSGYFMGSILAPNATVTAGVNVDGNIIANIVNITGGESHKWDIHPVEPNQPTQPTDPQPTDPGKPIVPPTDEELAGTPDPDPKPDPQPDPTPEKTPGSSTPVSPTPATPAATTPGTADYADQPVVTTTESTVATVAPVQTGSTPASAAATAEDEGVALPQTGTDNHGILLGIAMAIAAQLMIWGLVQPKKKK